MDERNAMKSSAQNGSTGNGPLDFLRGRGQVGWRAAVRISIGRALRDRMRIAIGLAYAFTYGAIVSYWSPALLAWLLAFFLGFIYTVLSGIPWRVRLHRKKRVSFPRVILTNGILSCILGLLFSEIALVFSLSLYGLIMGGPVGIAQSLSHISEVGYWPAAWAALFPVIGFSCVVGEDFERRGRRSAYRAKRMERLAEESRLTALRAQMNPHFFFNALNTVAALIPKRPTDAERAVELLAEALRPVMMRKQPLLSTVEREVRLAKAYAEIETLRFGDRLSVQFDVDEEANKTVVPSLFLQPFVENAVRHGVSRTSKPCRIAVGIDVDENGLCAEIANFPADKENVPREGTRPAPMKDGHALHNAQMRLKALFGTEANLKVEIGHDGSGLATIRIPAGGPTEAALELDRKIAEEIDSSEQAPEAERRLGP